MKNTATNPKSANLSNGDKSGVCKDFKDIWKLMDLVTELQNSERTLPTNGVKEIGEKKDYGNKS